MAKKAPKKKRKGASGEVRPIVQDAFSTCQCKLLFEAGVGTEPLRKWYGGAVL